MCISNQCLGVKRIAKISLTFLFVESFLSSFLFQCLWKVVRNLPKTISEVKVDQILLDIHTFLLTHPHQMWKNRADDTPLRTIKTVLYTLGKLKKQEVSNVNLSSLNFLVCALPRKLSYIAIHVTCSLTP